MIDIKATLDYLCSQASETEVLEFKRAKNTYDFNKLGKYFSALANEANLLGKEKARVSVFFEYRKKLQVH